MVESKESQVSHLRFNFRLVSKDNFKSFNRRTGLPFLSNKFKAFETAVAYEAKRQYKGKPLEGDLEVLIIAYYKNKVHPDCYNLPKSLCDSLNKLVWRDDRQIKKGMIEVIEGSKEDWFEVYVKER